MKRIKIVTALGCGLLFLCAVVSAAQESSPRSAIIVYGDPTQAWFDLVEEYSQLIDAASRPAIIRGDASTIVPENASVVWFGDLTFEPSETAGLPEELKRAVSELEAEIRDQPGDNNEGDVIFGVNCFTSHVDRSDDLPMVAVNFSGEDPQDFCKGFTMAHLLVGHQNWL